MSATLPAIGSKVYAVIFQTVVPVRVVGTDRNFDGIIGPWFSTQAGFRDFAFALTDENITWTRSDNPADHTALLAAHALLKSC